MDKGTVQSRARRGFTLVELLVVIGIIAVLIAMLFPALSRARYQAQVVQCSARLHQLIDAFIVYGQDNRGQMPNITSPSNGGTNLWDQSSSLYSIFITQYDFPHEMMFCPMMPDTLTSLSSGSWSEYQSAGFDRLGYCFWMPDKVSGKTIPPTPGDGQGFTINGTSPIAGPSQLTDPLASVNPIATDVVFSYNPILTPNNNTDLSKMSPAASGLYSYSQHLRNNGTLDSVNEAWIDGHVESIPGNSVHPRFLSQNNYWNWR